MESKEKTTNTLCISLTLPVACNICLGKVKEPVTCPNQHVFCSVCIDQWSKVHNHCPNCRVVFTQEKGCRRLIGAGTEESCGDCSQAEKAELRRTRLDLICREYESDISQLEEELNNSRSSNSRLEQELCRSNEQQARSHCTLSTDLDHCYAVGKPREETMSTDIDLSNLLEVTEQLQTMTRLYEKLNNSMRKLEEENQRLSNENFALRSEVADKRRANSSRDMTVSPRRVSRYTIAALEAELEKYQRQEDQLKKALKRSDQYTEQLERDLALLKRESQTPCHNEETDHKRPPDNVLVANEHLNFDILENLGTSSETVDVSLGVAHIKQEDYIDLPLMSHEMLPITADPLSLEDSLKCLYSDTPASLLSTHTSLAFGMPMVDADRCDAQSCRTRRRQTRQAGNMESHFPVRRRSFRLGSVGSFSSATGGLSKSQAGTGDGSGAKTLKWTL
ncbi:ORC ubiquitin ligase 1-like isoform X2 [Corticium candelabrum]|uniref:ORC ubiquitin ligase 1-like isoform X2 n=1 Tax=Corticium candelabrum TaxID=121492 RepID=UPI002E25D8DE|nr:ORC ubiquitin ligase 1-like isoform X2 [Corticium candelabrum]